MIDMTKLPEAPWTAGMLVPGADPNTQDVFATDVGGTTPTASGDLFNRIWGKPERYGETPGYTEPTQPWYFTDDPQSVYNPTFGFHDPNDIGRMYAQQGWQQTPEQFQSWGIGQNFGTPTSSGTDPPQPTTVINPDGTTGYQVPPGGFPEDTPDGGYGVGDYTGGGIDTGSPQGFQYPQEWDTASNVMTQFAMGLPTQVPQQWTEGANIASRMGQGITAPTPQQWTTGTEAATRMAGGDPTAIPQQWTEGSALASQMSQAGQTPSPWQWGTGSNVARQMAETGMPTSYEPWYQEAKSIVQRDTKRAIQQAAEQAGLSGLRWSDVLGQTAQRIGGEQMANLGLEFTDRQLSSLEASRARQLQGTQQLQQFGTGQAAIEEASRQRQLQGSQQLQGFGYGITGLQQAEQERGLRAASMLPGLGAQYLQAPQDWAQQVYGMGAGMTQLGQSALDRSYQDYMRMTPEQNPWVNQAMSYWGTPSQMGYQQYQPSTMSQVLGGAGSLGALGMGIGSIC